MRIALLALIVLLPAATATPSLGSPTDLQLSNADGDLILTWSAPHDWSPDHYRVYLDGQLAATTEATRLIVGNAHTYAVQAVSETQESAPALLASASTSGAENDGPTDCGYVTTNTNMSKPPFIFVRAHLDCFYWIEELIPGGPTEFRLFHWGS